MNKEEEKIGTKHVDTNTCMHTLLHTQMHHVISKPNVSQQQLRDTNQQQAAL